MVDAYLKRQWIRAIVFIDSKAPVWASTQRDQWTDRSIYNQTWYTGSANSLFGQSGTRGVHDPFVSCWHSDPVTRTLVQAHSRTNTRPHVRAHPLCTPMRAYWSPSIPIKYRRFWGSPNARAPAPRRLLHTWCRPTKYSRTSHLRCSAWAPIIAGILTSRGRRLCSGRTRASHTFSTSNYTVNLIL